jgi:P27 family predicted phage terminase small subunit
MMRGRRPEPAALQEAKGNPGRRKPRAQIEVAPADGRAPEHLSRDAKLVWAALAPELERLKFLRLTDVPAFARYCSDLAKYWEITRKLATQTETYWTESNHGRLQRVNPLFLVQDRIARRLNDIEDRFGLSPAARQRIFQQLAAATPMLPLGDTAPSTQQPTAESPIGLLTRLGTDRPN